MEKKYKGYNIHIEQDDFCDNNPDDWGDNGVFLTADSRNLNIERQGFMEHDLAEGSNGEEVLPYELDVYENLYENGKEYHVFPISVHDMIYFTGSNHPSGYVFVSFHEAGDRGTAREMAEGLINTWNHCLTGNVWGFIITKDKVCDSCNHNKPEDIDSCWGFIGDSDDCLQEAESVVDHLVEQEENTQQQEAIREGILNAWTYRNTK
jgi:hypothetical protein